MVFGSTPMNTNPGVLVRLNDTFTVVKLVIAVVGAFSNFGINGTPFGDYKTETVAVNVFGNEAYVTIFF